MAHSPLETSSQVELSISCSNLKKVGYFIKNDSAVFLYYKGHGQTDWTKLGRTEVMDNTLNPKFSTTFILDYKFEETQNLKFVVYDIEDWNDVDNIERQDYLGATECALADIMTAGQHLTKTFMSLKGTPCGKITIQAEEVQDCKFVVNFQIGASNLQKKNVFGKLDPFLEISKAQEGGDFTVVYRSEYIKNEHNPSWLPFEINIRKLCSGDWKKTLKFSVFNNHNMLGKNEYLVGTCSTSLKDICSERGDQVLHLELVDPAHKDKNSSHHAELIFVSVKVTPICSFVDYIRGGCKISLFTAIDFTASNDDPATPDSLHYLSPYKENEYVQAIRSVASVLAPYDSDQKICAYGFGAQLPPDMQTSHCFPLNFNLQDAEVIGVQGLLDAYKFTLHHVKLGGPTNLSPLLDTVMRYASVQETQLAQQYFILLIITKGEISDMSHTVHKIVAASKLPLSIIIVGVGGADFKNMEILDADETPLENEIGVPMVRDIVQFVPFRRFRSEKGENFSLAREILAEIPNQFMAFMRTNNIKPNPSALRRSEKTVYGGPQGSAPYPSGPQGSAPYPSGPQGSAPYPSGPQGPARNPSGPQGPAPNPSGPQGPTPNPSGPQDPTPNPCGPQGPAPNPSGPQGPAPNPSGPHGPAPNPCGPQGPAPNPSGPQGPTSNPSGPQDPAPNPCGPQGPAPNPSGPQVPAPNPSGPQSPAPHPSGPQGPAPNPSGPQGPTSNPSGPQDPAPNPSGPQGPAPNPSGPQGPTPNPSGPQGPTPILSGPQGLAPNQI